jgi:hypothetical protein
MVAKAKDSPLVAGAEPAAAGAGNTVAVRVLSQFRLPGREDQQRHRTHRQRREGICYLWIRSSHVLASGGQLRYSRIWVLSAKGQRKRLCAGLSSQDECF